MGEIDFLLVGGFGYLGSNVGPYLAGRGYRVAVLARRSSVAKRGFLRRVYEAAGIKVVTVEGSIGVYDVKAVAGDVIVQMAGVISGGKRRMVEAHVNLTRVAAEAAADVGARLVYVSAVAAVGRLPSGERVVTDGPPSLTRGVPENVYEETKAEGEHIVETHNGLKGRWVILRPGLLVGENAYHSEWRTLSRLARAGFAPRLGVNVPITHALDVAKVVEASRSGVFDGLAVMPLAGAWDLWEVVSRACRLRGKRCRAVPLSWALTFCPLTPPSSKARVACSMLRRRYEYRPRVAAEAGVTLATIEQVAETLSRMLFSS